MKTAEFIIAGDLHLDPGHPLARTDDFQQAQKEKLDFIRSKARMNGCPVIFPGDVFNAPVVPQWLEKMAIEEMPEFIAVPGQHDLPGNNIKNYGKTSLAVLEAGHPKGTVLKPEEKTQYLPCQNGQWFWIEGFWWGAGLKRFHKKDDYQLFYKIAVIHRLTWKNKKPWKGCTAESAKSLIKRMKQYDLIITGDNHERFIAEHEGTVLVNCGSVMRREADQTEHKPAIYLFTQDFELEEVELPINENVLSRKHIDQEKKKEEKRRTYVKNLKSMTRPGLNFRRNLEEELGNTTSEVADIVRQSLP